jgi:hypothetical protein
MKSPLILLPLFLSILCTNANPIPAPTPPNIPSGSTARSQLAVLRVAPVGSQTGYSRDLFPHWITQYGTCNTREVVLKRDGTNVVQDSACAAVSGRWYSPYDGATWTLASDVDIDHMVPLSNAWKVCQTDEGNEGGSLVSARRIEQKLIITLNVLVGSLILDDKPPSTIRQRPQYSSAHRRDRQRQPGERRSRS